MQVEAKKANRTIRPSPGGLALSADRIRDYVLRLKTTSIHTAKFAETLSVLLELVKHEKETAERLQD